MQNVVALCYHIISSETLLLQGMQAFLYGEKTLKNLCKFPIAAISYETRDMMEADRVMDEKYLRISNLLTNEEISRKEKMAGR